MPWELLSSWAGLKRAPSDSCAAAAERRSASSRFQVRGLATVWGERGLLFEPEP